MNYFFKTGCLSVVLLALCSCGERVGLAPVVDVKWRAVNSHAKEHHVVRGETLYAIAFRYDQDYRQLAIANHLHRPYKLLVGQIIRLNSVGVPTKLGRYQPNQTTHHAKTVWYTTKPSTNTTRPTTKIKTVVNKQSLGWLWPAHGKVIAIYAPQQGKKGIDIAGSKGEKIHASRDGVVAYAGSGLSGYGNLIIIKHDNQYLTAYGNNSKNLVKEGQRVHAGQAIAEMGVIDRHYWGVHFEIRNVGQPVNPMNYFQKG